MGVIIDGLEQIAQGSGSSSAVQGAGAAGSAVSGNPVLVAGTDGSNARTLKTDSTGALSLVPPTGASATQVQGAAASGAAVVGNPALVAGSDGTNARSLSVDTGGRLNVVGAVYTYSNITANTTTTVKSGAGVLRALVINIKGAAANSATIYDSTTGSGTKIGTVDTTTNFGTLIYDLAFTTGLTIVTATGTAPDITVVYR